MIEASARKAIRITYLVFPLLLAFATFPAWAEQKIDWKGLRAHGVAHKTIISQEKEIQAGKEYSAEIDRTSTLVKDPVINEYVNRIAQNIARSSDLTILLTVKV